MTMGRESGHDTARRAAEMASALVDDVRYSVRSLARARGLAAIVILLLTLGIGANTATFAVADELFLRPPSGVGRPSELRRLVLRTNWSVGHLTIIRTDVSYAAYRLIRDALTMHAVTAGYTHPDSANAQFAGIRRFVQVSYITPNFFSVVEARFAIGRGISEAEGAMGQGQPVAVISYALWQQRFGERRDVLGEPIEIAGQRYTIIGVAARSFVGLDLGRTDVWVPLAMFPWPSSTTAAWYRQWRMNPVVRIVTRPTPGTSESFVSGISTTAFRRGEAENVKAGGDSTAVVLSAPVLESLGPAVKQASESALAKRLLGVALIVLLIAVANVANLLLLRDVRKSRETAVRRALGVSRQRIVQQSLIESVLLSTVAAVTSIAVGAAGGAILRHQLLPHVHWAGGTFTPRLVVVSVAAAIATGIVSGLLPGFRGLDSDLNASLKPSARGGIVTHSALRTGFIAFQLALSMPLLAGAGLFIKSVAAVQSIDVGYDADRLVIGGVMFRDPVGHFVDESNAHDDEIAAGLAIVAQRLARSAAIEHSALSWSAPMASYAMVPVFTADRQPVPRLADRSPALLRVSPEYFGVTGVRLVHGRLFTAGDEASGEPMIVVNETAARTYWPGRDAIGQCLLVLRLTSPCSTVIGVTRDAHLEDIIEVPTVAIFQPMRLGARQLSKPSVIIARARPGRTDAAVAELRRELERAFPAAEPPHVQSLADAMEPELRPWRRGATLFAVSGILALAVATIGVYSALAFSLNQRTYELGVRIALGASGRQVAQLIAAESVLPIAIGVTIGTGLTLAMGRAAERLLYETNVSDPVVIAGACVVLVAAGLIGALGPAWRATRVAPVIALRAE